MTPNAPEAAGTTVPAQPDHAKILTARLDSVSKLFGTFAALRQVSLDNLPEVRVEEESAGKPIEK